MLEGFLIYALTVYWWYHLLGRSDLLARPRNWFIKVAPAWLSYPLSCAFCFAWWSAWAVTVLALPFGVWMLTPVTLFAAPVFNLVLDLCVKALMRANEPPVMGEGKTLTSGDQSISTWRAPFVSLDPAGYAPFAFTSFKDEPLDRPELLGRYIKRRSDGLTGPIREVFRCGDDCAGSFRQVCYRVSVDCGSAKVEASTCDLIDTPFNPLDHEQTK